MLRVPQEPDPTKYPGQEGVVVPEALDFGKLKEKGKYSKKNVEKEVKSHIDECIKVGLELTALPKDQDKAPHFDHFKTATVPLHFNGVKQELDIRVEYVKVAGVPDEQILGVRHTVDLPLNPYVFFDALNRLNYTDLIDKYTNLVEQVENIKLAEGDDTVSWCHVAYTTDKIAPFFSHRDFVTFDFVSEKFLLVNSRSCLHPSRQLTSVPTWFPSLERRVYRVPLQYFQRVIPHESNPNFCTVVQFQFSDVGGVASPEDQTKAVVQFGIDNIPKVVGTIFQALQNGAQLGKEAPGYMQNPLDPCWRQSPKDMIPGLVPNKL